MKVYVCEMQKFHEFPNLGKFLFTKDSSFKVSSWYLEEFQVPPKKLGPLKDLGPPTSHISLVPSPPSVHRDDKLYMQILLSTFRLATILL